MDPTRSPRASASPWPTSASRSDRSRRPAASGGRLERRVIAVERDQPDRLLQRERCRRVDRVARRGRQHARDPGDRGGIARGRGDAELVAAPECRRIVAQAGEQRRERQQQDQDGAGRRQDRDDRERTASAGRREARAEHGRARAESRAAGTAGARRGELGAAQQYDGRPSRCPSGRHPRRRGDERSDDAQCGAQRRHDCAARRELVQGFKQRGGGPVCDQCAQR